MEKHLTKMPHEMQQALFARFIQPMQASYVAAFPLEHERAKYAELFSLIYVRTGTSSLKDAF